MDKIKKTIKIFSALVFGLPVILGIFMGMAYAKGMDTGIFPLTWMYLPAFGVMAGKLLTYRNHDNSVPKIFYYTFSGFSVIMIILCMVSVITPQLNLAAFINVLVMIFCPICLIEILCMKKEKREQCGLSFFHNWRRSVLGIVLFAGLYLATGLLGFLFEKVLLGKAEGYGINQNAFLYAVITVISFPLSFTAYFGEEYGWRYFLQPVMQKKFGVKCGVILLGLLWGIWHLPINLFYYSPETSLQSILVQLAGCVGMGIFFGWVYMRTHNIWAVTIMHFLNNNMGVVLFAASPSGVAWNWQTTLISISAYLIVYLPFLLTKEYRVPHMRNEHCW